MTDQYSQAKRSEIMSRVKAKNSAAELIVFSELKKRNIYFQKHYKNAPGTPDIALPRKKKAVFIDGDFWHGRTFEKLMEKDSLNDYWVQKLVKNMDRDKKQQEQLAIQGWKVLRVWESDIKRKKTQNGEIRKIIKFLKS